jgi:hypothetical protein
MALTWSLEHIENYKEKCFAEGTDGKYLRSLTEVLIFYTMAVGIPRITSANTKEFYERVRTVEAVNGPAQRMLIDDEVNYIPVLLKDVEEHIGLSTNADTLSAAKFKKNWQERALAVLEAKHQLAVMEELSRRCS